MPRLKQPNVDRLIRVGEPGKVSVGESLHLCIRGPGRAFWVHEYREPGSGRRRGVGFGNASEVTLFEAMKRRHRFDPAHRPAGRRLDSRQNARQAVQGASGMTFAAALDAWCPADSTQWSAKGVQARRGLVETKGRSLAAIDVAKIMSTDVLAALENETPRMRVDKLSWLIDFFSFCKAKPREWITGDNPARLDADTRDNLPKVKKEEQKHHARVSRDDIPALYAGIVDGETARALRFLILTAARAGDVEGATWSEIYPPGATFTNADGDLEKLVCDAWIIPAERAKERKRRIVPLPPQAMAILGKRGAANALLFGRLPANAMLNLLQKTHPGKTVHGMRSVFRDWAIRQPAVPLEHGASMRDLAELQMGHELPKASAVEKTYARDGLYDLRASLMAKWAAFATGN